MGHGTHHHQVIIQYASPQMKGLSLTIVVDKTGDYIALPVSLFAFRRDGAAGCVARESHCQVYNNYFPTLARR